jgi:uncharacterized protein DUF1566/caspase domain-containing protein
LSIKLAPGETIDLYRGSYALLIGASDYTGGWPDLESIPYEVELIEDLLKRQGFHIVKVLDPNSEQLRRAFEFFISQFGFEKQNRLLFFFSGHGHSRENGKKGYIVPVDAPDPRFNDKEFLQKALNMSMIMAWAKIIEAKHALFVFDSCFSGTIFKLKALPKNPPHISDMTSRPTRQFITAGSAGEPVPAKSVFAPSFVRALKGEGDLNQDGYVTGTELGMYLHQKVLYYGAEQTPQYGKIKDPDLDEGDFVFALKNKVPWHNKTIIKRDTESAYSVALIPPKKKLITLREKPAKIDSHDVESILFKYNFFETHKNASGNFKNQFIDNGNGTVTDRSTGLTWQKGGSSSYMPWQENKKYLKMLNRQSFAGSANWRLPTTEELASLLESEKINGFFIDPIFSSDQRYCWTTDMFGMFSAWYITFVTGSIFYEDVSNRRHVRAVYSNE